MDWHTADQQQPASHATTTNQARPLAPQNSENVVSFHRLARMSAESGEKVDASGTNLPAYFFFRAASASPHGLPVEATPQTLMTVTLRCKWRNYQAPDQNKLQYKSALTQFCWLLLPNCRLAILQRATRFGAHRLRLIATLACGTLGPPGWTLSSLRDTTAALRLVANSRTPMIQLAKQPSEDGALLRPCHCTASTENTWPTH